MLQRQILAITWLGMIEGQQASLVGLPPVDPELYKDSHPITYKNGALAFQGDNFDRYLMGRQFMVLLVVFVINQCAQPLDPAVDVLNMPEVSSSSSLTSDSARSSSPASLVSSRRRSLRHTP